MQQGHLLLKMRPAARFVSGRGGLLSLAEFQEQRAAFLWWPLPAEDLPHVLTIIRSGGLGDILLMRPAIRALKKARPDMTIRVVTDWPELANGDVNDSRAAFFEGEPVLFLNEWVEWAPRRFDLHRSDIFARGMGLMECQDYSFDGEVQIDAPRLIEEDYIALQYMGSNKFRCPSVAWMNELALRLPLPTVAIGDRPVAAETTYNFIPCDKERLFSIVRHARLVIAGDSGPFHLARAMGVPCIGLYGPYPADLRVRDTWPTCRVIESRYPKENACGPCQEAGYCDRLEKAECLDAIDIDEVLSIAHELLGE